nr:hypothetical protein [Tanacetum cinerariifolium]
MRIEQYFLMTDYSLWEVILNGDSPVPTRIVEGVVQPVAPTTAEQKLVRKNELKARGTLLMALPDKHQLKFNSQKAAKRRKLSEEAQEAEDLRKRLEVVKDEDDDVFIEATPLAKKVHIVDYQIVLIDNKPRFKIIRADETHQFYINFTTLLLL